MPNYELQIEQLRIENDYRMARHSPYPTPFEFEEGLSDYEKALREEWQESRCEE